MAFSPVDNLGTKIYRNSRIYLLDIFIRLLYDFVWKEFSIGPLSGVYGGM